MFERNIDIDEVLNSVSAKDVVEKYLGEPEKIIGKNNYYSTPFRDNVVSSATLLVNDRYIMDMGGEFKGNFINFVAELKDVSFAEALRIIAKDFEITNLAEILVGNEIITEVIKEKTERIVLEVGENAEEIIAMFDNEPYNRKPTSEEIGKIKEKIPRLKMVPYPLNVVRENLIKGYTVIPSGIKDKADKNWKQQQLFMVDIDNAHNVNGKMEKILSSDDKHITVEKAVEYCESIGLTPTFIYNTFSHTDECHKLRLVYVLEKPITDIKLAKDVYSFLKESLGVLNIDEAPTNLETMFLGGKSLPYCSGICYKAIKKEFEIEKEEYKMYHDLGRFNAPAGKLKDINYDIDVGKLCRFHYKKDKSGKMLKVRTPICNFLPVISKQITYFNGRDSHTDYTINGLLVGENKELPEIIVSKEDLAKVDYSICPEWNIQAIKEPNRLLDDEIRYVSQYISKDFIECKTVYAHTGFLRINGKLVYLHHGGVLGDVKDLEVDLSLDKLEQYHFTDEEYDLKDALETSYSMLDVAESKIAIPLLATTYLSPLTTLFNENGLYADFVVWVEGKTGTRKSSLVAVELSHFGSFSRNRYPCSFRDTANSLEKKGYVLKDTVMVVDDFCPETVGTGKTGTSEKLFAGYADRAGRDRMSSNSKTLKGAYVPRGLCIVTGESFPKVSQSRSARVILLEMRSDSVDLKKLRVLQENADKLSFAMKNFILWVIDNESKIIKKAKEKQREMDEKSHTNISHGRTWEAVTMLSIGFSLFLDFLCEKGVITPEERDAKEKEANSVFEIIAENQTKEIESENPITMFTEGVKQLYASEKVQIINYNIPCDSRENHNLIGYYDDIEGLYYLMPDVVYKETVKFYREQGIKFPISKRSLFKMLDDEGYLYITEKSDRRTVKRRVPNTQASIPVIAIYQNKLGLDSIEQDLRGYAQMQENLRKACITK
ncbi:MAG: hypothetical protein IJN50_02580 [Clostridia bacterium]|nr:hypothetical protein [Clostridia bacterium]